MLDALAALRLQMEWGADEALADEPADRLAAVAPVRPAPPLADAPAPAGPSVSAGTIAELLAAWQALAGLGLRDTASHFVPPAGDEAAEIMLVAEAPDAEDDRTGRAFSGAAGALLDRVLGSIGLRREGMLLMFLAPWRPPGGRRLGEAEIQACLPFARQLLTLVRPRLLILVGAVPVRALTGDATLSRRARGRILHVQMNNGQIVVPAVALPAIEQWMNGASSKQRLWSDLIFLQRATAKP